MDNKREYVFKKLFGNNKKNNKKNNKNNKNNKKNNIENHIENHIKNVFDDKWLNYFPDDDYKFQINIETKPLYDDIKKFDYIEPIKRLKKYYNEVEYYDKLIKEYKNCEKEYINDFLYIDGMNETLDEVMLQYSKCFKNMFVMTVWPRANLDIKSEIFKYLLEILEKFGTIHCIKRLKLSKDEINSLFFQIYAENQGMKNIKDIRTKSKRCGWDINHCMPFFVILFETEKTELISGKNSEFKNKIRNFLMKHSKYSINNSRGQDFLHINDTFQQTLDYCTIYFNQNSIELLGNQRIDKFLYFLKSRGIYLFLTYKKIIALNIDLIDKIRFMLFSSSILFSLGLRQPNDIDLLIYDKPKSKKIEEIFFFDDKYKTMLYGFIEPSMKGKYGWEKNGEKEYLIDWFEKEWPKLFGAENLTEVFFNPKYHMYFFGEKLISIFGDLVRRIKRSRPASFANLIALKTFIEKYKNYNMNLSLDKTYWVNHVQKTYLNDDEQKILFLKIRNYLIKRYKIYMTEDQIKKMFTSSQNSK